MEKQGILVGKTMEKQSSFRRGIEKQVSFKGVVDKPESSGKTMEKQKSFRLVMERQFSFKKSKESPGKRGDLPLHLFARAGNLSKIKEMLQNCDNDDCCRNLLCK